MVECRGFIPRQDLEEQIHVFISSRLDNCNGLFSGPNNTRKTEHIKPVLRSLHWLSVCQRIKFKVGTFVYEMCYTNKLAFPYKFPIIVIPVLFTHSLGCSVTFWWYSLLISGGITAEYKIRKLTVWVPLTMSCCYPTDCLVPSLQSFVSSSWVNTCPPDLHSNLFNSLLNHVLSVPFSVNFCQLLPEIRLPSIHLKSIIYKALQEIKPWRLKCC